MSRAQERRRWVDRQPHKLLYVDKSDNLRACVFCGNRYPFTRKWFSATNKENLRGLRYEGLAQICLICVENWGDTLKDDARALVREVEEARAAGDMRPVTPLARRKKG